MSDQEQETANVYTPSTETVRSRYVIVDDDYEDSGWEAVTEFDRWLEARDRVVAAKALEDKRKTLHALAETYEKTAERLSDEERYLDSNRYFNYASGLDMAAEALRVQGETKP